MKTLIVSTAFVCVLQGCANQPGSTATQSFVGVAGGLLGGAVGVVAAKALASYDGKRLKLSASEIKKRERGYMITFALLGAAGGSSLAGNVYGKLQEQGKKEREAALLAAVQQARPQRYGEPSDQALKGLVTPGRPYAELTSNRECVDVEDALNDGKSNDSIFVKMCRSMPSGGWQQVTA